MGLTLNLAVACNSGDKVTAEHTPKESEKRGKEKEQKKMKEKKEKKKSKKLCGSKMAKDFTTPRIEPRFGVQKTRLGFYYNHDPGLYVR